ncbi:hypothetical protein DFH06DRAFT_1032169 [Mycena polygramma]|nr:hypothetical protein DFH06DRAFT_1032169 [Mycena polygramma]
MADATMEAATAELEEEDWDGEYEEDEDEEDLEAQAQRLQEQLWADIRNVSASAPPPTPPPRPKEQAAVLTVRAILASLEHDALAQSTLAAAKIPDFGDDSLLAILRNIADSGKIPRGVALPISRFVVSLAKSEVLFGSLRHSDAPCVQLKRKREEADEHEREDKRLCLSKHPLYVEVAEAVRVISQTITNSQALDAPLIASIQPQLHRVFLFAVTSSAAPGSNTNALQEISGLIQVLGVLSGTQIGQASNAEVSTAVYPCLVDGCGKFFARLYSLRAHRHGVAWKCAGCNKVFPRQDAHKTTAKCVNAAFVEVQATAQDPEEGELEADIVSEVQTTVLALHALLQAHVARALGASAPSPDPTNGQATLASVIARAQSTHATNAVLAPPAAPPPTSASLSVYGLSGEQTKQLEEAITNAATAAQAEAEAQAALEEDEEDGDGDGDEDDPNFTSPMPPRIPPQN